VLVARALLGMRDRVLAGPGAFRFARRLGLKAEDTRTPAAVRRWKARKASGGDTVGACALDREGRLASATSTGGHGMTSAGRVSDSAMPVGNYADFFSAVSCTGAGEEIMDEGLAVRIAALAAEGMPLKRAFRRAFERARMRARKFGAIGVDRRGRIAIAKTTPELFYAWKTGARSGAFR
jgi:L-asparaginase